MGILNVTPDSFSDGGLFGSPELAIEHAERMIDEGADLIDVGGESTRPGAQRINTEDELERVLTVVDCLATKGYAVSIDTRNAEVARVCLDSGAKVVNDVSGFRDPKMVEVAGRANCIVCAMHMLGEPGTMQENPVYGDVVAEVLSYLKAQALMLSASGLKDIWIDPGIGFGKTVSHNLKLLANVGQFVDSGWPVLIGVSRKSFIGKVLDLKETGDRLEGSLACQAMAQIQGARILRVHDVRAAVRVAKLISAVAAA